MTRKLAGKLAGLTAVALALTGCAGGPFAAKPGAAAGTGESVDPAFAAAPPPENARTAAQFDTVSAEQKRAAAAVPAAGRERELGSTIASLGNAADPGLWAETPLVREARSGRLVYPVNGRSIQVELRPSGGAPGAGTSVSLSAFTALGAPLTGLPELVVFAGPPG